MKRTFIHFCALDRECRAELRGLHITMFRVGNWSHTVKLPGYKKLIDSLEYLSTGRDL